MGEPLQVRNDFNLIQKVLTEALTWPKIDHLGKEGYHEAHVKAQQALQACQRLRKAVRASDVGATTYLPNGKILP